MSCEERWLSEQADIPDQEQTDGDPHISVDQRRPLPGTLQERHGHGKYGQGDAIHQL